MTNPTFQSSAFQSSAFQTVAFEVCEAFRAPVDHDEPVCAGCGHLADDHDRAEATVTALRQPPVRRQTPVRKAS